MSDIQACETVCPCVDICEIARLRAEVDDLKRINMNLRYLIPEAVWMDEADRLRGDNQESPVDEIERLRSEESKWTAHAAQLEALITERERKIEDLRAYLEQDACAIENLQNLINAWADARDAWDGHAEADAQERVAIKALLEAVGR